MATNCKSLIRKSHFADIYVIYLHFSYLYDNTYLYMQGCQSGLKSVGANETFLRPWGKEFIVCLRLRDHKIYRCKCTLCTQKFGALVYMHTSYFKKQHLSTYKHWLPFFCFFINNEKIWKFLGKCITILVRVTPYCIYYILQYFCAQLLMYFQVQNFFVREMCQMRSHKEKLYIDSCIGMQYFCL